MSQYKTTPAQQAYLRKKYAKQKDDVRSCDCAGCDKCTGNVVGCKCDEISAADLRQYRR